LRAFGLYRRTHLPLGKQYSVVAACTPATDGKCRYFRIIFRRDQPLEEGPRGSHCIHVATVLPARARPIRETGAVEVGRVC